MKMIALAAPLCLALCTAATGVPELLNYQGRLVEDGMPVQGQRTLVFELYNTETAGAPLYGETQTVMVVDGLYATEIGASNTVPGALSSVLTNDAVWLQITVDEKPLTPRQRITAVAYALVADGTRSGGITSAMLAEGAVTSGKIQDGAVTSVHIADHTVTSEDIADNTVTSADIADGSVTSEDLAEGAVGGDALAREYQSGVVYLSDFEPAHDFTSPCRVECSVTFPRAFSLKPIVTLNVETPDALVGTLARAYLVSRSATGFSAGVTLPTTGRAIDPEAGYGTDGSWPSLAIINGHPAVAYYKSSPYSDLMYVRADDPSGTQWGSPVTVATDGNVGWFASLAEVDGLPAIACGGPVAGKDLMFIRALDADGTSWGTPIGLDVTGWPWGDLAVIGGRPAICYNGYGGGSRELRYTQAINTIGSAWTPPVTIAPSLDTGMAMVELGSRPARASIAYSSPDELMYVRALNAEGSSWAAPIALHHHAGYSASMCLVGNRPAVSYYCRNEGTVNYLRALDTAGTSWGPTMTVDRSFTLGLKGSTSLAVISGHPAIVYSDGNGDSLRYARANDTEGASWAPPVEIDHDMGGQVGGISLAWAGLGPGIAYYEDDSQGLFYLHPASLDDGFRVNWIAIEPWETGVSP